MPHFKHIIVICQKIYQARLPIVIRHATYRPYGEPIDNGQNRENINPPKNIHKAVTTVSHGTMMASSYSFTETQRRDYPLLFDA